MGYIDRPLLIVGFFFNLRGYVNGGEKEVHFGG
jgi:hypothetical protein